MQLLVIASNNAGKIREFRALLAEAPVALIAAREVGITTFPPEDGATFRDNAIAKARFATAEAQLPALADDSGLVVDALGGAPGVYSARYGGPDLTDPERCALVLKELTRLPGAARAARFVAVVACAFPGDIVIDSEGTIEGHIADGPRGNNGFGYDSIFVPDGSLRTFAELSDAEKHAVSHRARAVRALLPQIIVRHTAPKE